MQAGSLARLLCRQMAAPFSSMYRDTEALSILLDVAVGLQHLHNASPYPIVVSWYCALWSHLRARTPCPDFLITCSHFQTCGMHHSAPVAV